MFTLGLHVLRMPRYARGYADTRRSESAKACARVGFDVYPQLACIHIHQLFRILYTLF